MLIYRHRATIKPKRKEANTMKLTLKETIKTTEEKYEIYEIGKYGVEVTTYENGDKYIRVFVTDRNDRYIPEIYCTINRKSKAIEFSIQTSSYGSLSADEIKQVIAGYNEALEVVEILTKEFVNA
jgi:hypothetical protein